MADYKETKMSQRAKRKLEEISTPDSYLRKEVEFLRYNQRSRERVNNPDGSLNLVKAYQMLGVENQEIVLLKRCIEWNLSEEQAHELIKHRYRECYASGEKNFPYGIFGGVSITLSEYPRWCEFFSIKPDEKFPDWGDPEKVKKIKEVLEKNKDKLGL
ncbi:MAG: hypothetical protein PHH54_05250 [Candidatus Nanoarchaeia archaeon]|nr:hypothetical protein [Candidatus Nanoarchaeia archaeon]MDD5741364.1 hypothetical protein [Candidatus Nanoarchaeia archaeon]